MASPSLQPFVSQISLPLCLLIFWTYTTKHEMYDNLLSQPKNEISKVKVQLKRVRHIPLEDFGES